MDKLNLNGLSEWSPHNAATVRELLFSYHNIFALKVGCTSGIEHEICINNDKPFKERFRCIPPPLLEEVCASLRDMLDAGTISPFSEKWDHFCPKSQIFMTENSNFLVSICTDL